MSGALLLAATLMLVQRPVELVGPRATRAAPPPPMAGLLLCGGTGRRVTDSLWRAWVAADERPRVHTLKDPDELWLRLLEGRAPVLHFGPTERLFPVLPFGVRLYQLATAVHAGAADSARKAARLPWVDRENPGDAGWNWDALVAQYRDEAVDGPGAPRRLARALLPQIEALERLAAYLSDLIGRASPPGLPPWDPFNPAMRQAIEDYLRDSGDKTRQFDQDSAVVAILDSLESRGASAGMKPPPLGQSGTLRPDPEAQSLSSRDRLMLAQLRAVIEMLKAEKVAEFKRDSAVATIQYRPDQKFNYLLYRGCGYEEDETGAIWTHVGHDPQTVRRQDLPDALRQAARERVITIDYWMYYLADRGLTGHPHDLERLTVVLPWSTAIWLATGDTMLKPAHPLQLLVGAAHTPIDPNNILLLDERAEIRMRPNALVELGGHAVSPDRVPYQEFTSGWDINFRSGERGWGLRDIQAVNGTGFSGAFRPGWSFPRKGTVSTTLCLRAPDCTAAEDTREYQLMEVDSLQRTIRLLTEVGLCGEAFSWSNDVGGARRRQLDALAASFRGRGGCRSTSPVGQAEQGLLARLLQLAQLPPGDSTEAMLAALRASAGDLAVRWIAGSRATGDEGLGEDHADSTRYAPWAHQANWDPPVAMLKEGVYYPAKSELWRRLGIYSGVILDHHVWRVEALYEFPLMLAPLVLPGTLEVHAGVGLPTKRGAPGVVAAARMQWNSAFNDIVGVNAIVDYLRDRDGTRHGGSQADFQLGVGISLWLPNLLAKKLQYGEGWKAYRTMEVRCAMLGVGHGGECGFKFRFNY